MEMTTQTGGKKMRELQDVQTDITMVYDRIASLRSDYGMTEAIREGYLKRDTDELIRLLKEHDTIASDLHRQAIAFKAVREQYGLEGYNSYNDVINDLAYLVDDLGYPIKSITRDLKNDINRLVYMAIEQGL